MLCGIPGGSFAHTLLDPGQRLERSLDPGEPRAAAIVSCIRAARELGERGAKVFDCRAGIGQVLQARAQLDQARVECVVPVLHPRAEVREAVAQGGQLVLPRHRCGDLLDAHHQGLLDRGAFLGGRLGSPTHFLSNLRQRIARQHPFLDRAQSLPELLERIRLEGDCQLFEPGPQFRDRRIVGCTCGHFVEPFVDRRPVLVERGGESIDGLGIGSRAALFLERIEP